MNVNAHLPEDHKSSMIFYGLSHLFSAETICFWSNKFKDKKELIRNLELNISGLA